MTFLNLLQLVPGQQMSSPVGIAELVASGKKKSTGTNGAGLRFVANRDEKISGVLAQLSPGGGDSPRQRASSSGLCFAGSGRAPDDVNPVPSPKLRWLKVISRIIASCLLLFFSHASHTLPFFSGIT